MSGQESYHWDDVRDCDTAKAANDAEHGVYPRHINSEKASA